MIYALWLLIFILIISLIKLIGIEKNKLLVFLISFIIILFVVNLKLSMSSAIYGAKLWFNALLPTLFPFTTLCNLLIAYGGIDVYSKLIGPIICKPLKLSKACSFPLFASFLCGYPLGCKYSSDLYSDGAISRKEYIRLVSIATNCGPIFIMGSVALTMLNNPKAGYILLFSNYISIFIIAIMTIREGENNSAEYTPQKSNKSFGDNLRTSIENAINTSFMVGGFVILFCVLISIIKNNAHMSIIFNTIESFLSLPKDSLYGIFLGSIEITNGASIISSSSLILPLKLSIISFLCSFSGLSIIAQASSFIGKHNFPMGRYIGFKFVQGIISFTLTYLLCSIVPISTTAWTGSDNFSINIIMYFIPFILMTIISILFMTLKKLFFHSS
ncbi:MAG: sporulation integral membrane protein YlbJ [Clostridium sp.]